MSFIYSAEELKFIRDSYQKLSDVEVAKALNRSLRAIQGKRFVMGLNQRKEQLSKHAHCYELRVMGYPYKQIADIVGISERMVKKAVKKFLPYKGGRPKTIVLQSKINYETHTKKPKQRVHAQDVPNLQGSER